MAKWLDDIEQRLASAQCSYMGRCNSSRCPKHGGEARALRKLLRVALAADAWLAWEDAQPGGGEAPREMLREALRGEP
ncbi:MAG TPA: hypothetical protein VM513_08945 [Kofleriaceae bacterium]|jgi:hypothetical protein|nr:hypothetical protein [Kofleriaceae bacterium]